MVGHYDVAGYALGALDEGDRTRFEEHLVTCGHCAEELESLLPVVDLLSGADLRDVEMDDPVHPPAPQRLTTAT